MTRSWYRGSQPEDRFEALRLNFWTDHSWAVVNSSTGAIATLKERLIMRLTEAEAKALARELNSALDEAAKPSALDEPGAARLSRS